MAITKRRLAMTLAQSYLKLEEPLNASAWLGNVPGFDSPTRPERLSECSILIDVSHGLSRGSPMHCILLVEVCSLKCKDERECLAPLTGLTGLCQSFWRCGWTPIPNQPRLPHKACNTVLTDIYGDRVSRAPRKSDLVLRACELNNQSLVSSALRYPQMVLLPYGLESLIKCSR